MNFLNDSLVTITNSLSSAADIFSVSTCLLGLAVLLLTSVLFWFKKRYHRLISTAYKLPSLNNNGPILSYLPIKLILNNDEFSTFTELLIEAGDKKNKNCSLWFGPYPFIVLGDPHDVHTVLNSKNCKPNFLHENFKPIFGNGLPTAHDDAHKVTRPHLMDLFSHKNLKQNVLILNKNGRHLVSLLQEYAGCGPIDIQDVVSLVSIKNICEFLMGSNIAIDEKSDDIQSILEGSDTISKLLITRATRPWLWSDAAFDFFHGHYIREKKNESRKLTAELLQKGYNERRLEVISYTDQKEEVQNKSNLGPRSYLTLPDAFDKIERVHAQFTDQYMHDELLSLLVLGTHSNRIGISSILLALAACPDVQERLYEEVVSVVGAECSDITGEDLNRMPYLEQVLKESYRKFSIVPVMGRTALSDIKLRDFTIPAGAEIIISLMTLHYNSDAYPNPRIFNPENFSRENVSRRNIKAYAPFSAGKRHCIGGMYSAMSIKTIVIHVIRNFRLTTSMDIHNLKFGTSVANYSLEGYKMELHQRSINI